VLVSLSVRPPRTRRAPADSAAARRRRREKRADIAMLYRESEVDGPDHNERYM